MAMYHRPRQLETTQLPKPDAWGNYWLGTGTNRVHGPCLLHSNVKDKAGNVIQRWFVSLGNDGGCLFSGSELRYFSTPEAALLALVEAQ